MNKTLPRIFRHALTDYCKEDIRQTTIYSDDYFRNLTDHGFTATWIRASVNDLVAFRTSPDEKQKRNFKQLAALAANARKHGIKVYLYSCEPWALAADDPFFKKYPEARGEPSRHSAKIVNSLCTSTEIVRDRIRETSRELFSRIPELGGAFLITASEHQSHCYSHVIVRPGIVFCGKAEHHGISCPRCAKRTATEVVAESLNCFHDGVEMAKSDALVIAWNWSWSMFAQDPQTDILKRLKKEIVVMSGFERGGHKIIGGKKRFIDEYSLSYTGPSPRFAKTFKTAKSLGIRSMAKLQLNVTHELATVPNVPLLSVLYKKLDNLQQKGIEGYLGTWNFGCCFTMNTFAVKQFHSYSTSISMNEFIMAVGNNYLGGIDGKKFISAIKGFATAFNFYPFYRRFTHYGPMSHALSIPITMEYNGKTALTPAHCDLPRGNDWESCFGPYSLAEVINLTSKMAKRWDNAMKYYTKALFPETGFTPHEWGTIMTHPAITLDSVNKSPEACLEFFIKQLPTQAIEAVPALNTIQGFRRLEEWLSAYTAGACMKSALNLLMAHQLHTQSNAKDKMDTLRSIIRDEIDLVQTILPLLKIDERLGHHGEAAAHLFNVDKLNDKIKKMAMIR